MINDMSSFSEHGYVVYDNTKWDIEYDGNQESIPDEYRVAYGAEPAPAPEEVVNTNADMELAEEMSEEEVMLLEAQAEQGMILEP